MEGKTVVLSFLIVSLVTAQNQVEAGGICCPSITAKTAYTECFVLYRLINCAETSGCIYFSGTTCPPGYPYAGLGNSGDTVNEYCKFGCASSVCGALTTLQDNVNEAVAQCTNACSNFCTKDSANAVETA